MVELRGKLVTQWNNLYPGTPFPMPDNNPQMFPQNFVIKNTVYQYDYSWWDDLWGDCCAFSRCCPKGYIDYTCQFQNSCYINLINLGIHVLAVLLGVILLTIILGYASRLAYKFVVSVAFLTKFMQCLGGCMKCLTFGVFDEKVYYKNQIPKAEYTEEEKMILEKAHELDLKIIIPRLDSHKKKRLLEIFEDYEIIDENQLCCGKPNNAQKEKEASIKKTYQNDSQNKMEKTTSKKVSKSSIWSSK